MRANQKTAYLKNSRIIFDISSQFSNNFLNDSCTRIFQNDDDGKCFHLTCGGGGGVSGRQWASSVGVVSGGQTTTPRCRSNRHYNGYILAKDLHHGIIHDNNNNDNSE